MGHLVLIRTTSYSQLPVLREERRAQSDPVLSCTIGCATSLLRREAVVLVGLCLAAMAPLGAMAQAGPVDPVPQVSTGAPAGTASGGGPIHTTSLAAAVTIDMVSIPGGSFTMGSPDSERGRSTNEGPRHQVTVAPFSLSKTEITQGQWQAVMGTPMSTSCGDQYGIGAGYPVYCVSWDEVAGPGGFIEKLNDAMGTNTYRLPSEAEWEYAARAGSSGPFSFSAPSDWSTRCDTWTEAKNHMWWCGNAGSTSHPAGEKQPNGRGLYDMHGSVWEWVQDLYHGTYDGAPTDGSAWDGSPGAGSRVVRGGDWTTFAEYCRSAARGSKNSWDKSHAVGFRVASSPRNDPLTGKIGIKDSRTTLWPLDGQKVKSIKVSARPADGSGLPVYATVTHAVYTFDGLQAGTYHLECEVTYEEEVTIDNYSRTRGGAGCAGGNLTKVVRVRQRDVTAPGTVDIEFPRPVVMLHGYRSCYQKWFEPSSAVRMWDNYVRLEGFQGDLGLISLTPNYDFTESDWQVIANQTLKNIGDDLRGLSRQIDTDSYPQWDIVAHSMGGLVSRVITHHKGNFAPLARSLRKIFIMGTPNSGIVAAQRFSHFSQENIQGGFNKTYPKYRGKHAEAWAGTDGISITTDNDQVVWVDSVQTITQASVGTKWVSPCGYCPNSIPLSEIFEPNKIYDFKDRGVFFTHRFSHFQLGSPDDGAGHPRTDILVNQILPKLVGAAPKTSASAAEASTAPTEMPMVVVAAGSLHLGAGQAETVSFPCEPTDLVVVIVTPTSSDLTFHLRDPDGARATVGVTPSGSVEHGVGETGEEWYAITNPETGAWEVRMSAGASACDADYTVMVRSPFQLQVSVADPVVAKGGAADLLANWRETPPPGTTTSVTADLVNGVGTTVETVTLHDDGNHGDWLAGDGLFAGTSGTLGATGRYEVRFRATGMLGGSAEFSRTHGGLVDVVETGRYFTGSFSDSAADSDGDGVYDAVTASIGVNLPAAGSYLVTGRLVDGDGYHLDEGVGTLEATASGAKTVNLSLSLADAGCGQFANGFLVTDIELRDGATLTVLDRWAAPVATAVYAGSTFECQTTTPAPAVLAVQPSTVFRGEEAAVLISGSGFQSGARVNLGAGVVVQQVSVASSDTIFVNAAVDASAALGPRDVSVTNPDLLEGVLAGGFTVGSDQPPSISIVHPAPQQSLSGDVTFSANARDDRGIASVDFRIDSTLIGSDGSFPYQAQWQAGSGASGSHLLEAIARDTIGQTSTATVQFQVGSTAPRLPGRRVTSGSDGQCTYSLSPPSRSHGAEAGSGTISVSTTAGCGWTATPAVGWIHIDSGTSGNGSGTVTYRVDANGGATARSGAVAVASKNFVISQAGGGGAADEMTIMLPGNVPLTLVRIPAGTFQMGSPTSERGRSSGEQLHEVRLTRDYYMGKYEVTQQQWAALMGSIPSGIIAIGDTHPVYRVSWDEIVGGGGFLEKLRAHLTATGQPGAALCRLPTEAEWEHAARAGTTTPFSFGDDPSCSLSECTSCALFDQYMVWCGSSTLLAQPVGQKQPNPWGLYDMHGNVSEWVADWFDSYPSGPVVDPTGPSSGLAKVLRGGYNYNSASECRSADRDSYWPDRSRSSDGFRLVCSVP